MLKDHKEFFLHKYKDKSEHDYDSIYWRGIGIARKRLSDTENITIAKYMNGWLNSGRQKGLFGEQPECPCCGWHKETQLHMFQCMNPDMRRTQTSSFKLLKTYYHEHKIPAMVYIPFLRMCKAACNFENFIWHDKSAPEIKQATDSQQVLGGEFLLQGYLTPDWLEAIRRHHPDKPEQCMTHLYLGLWKTLFASIWEQRNVISHGKESIVTKIEREQLLDELREWRRTACVRLGASQQYLINYNRREIETWTTTTMRKTVNLLVKAAINFKEAELDKSQPLITQYFTRRSAESNFDTSEPT